MSSARSAMGPRRSSVIPLSSTEPAVMRSASSGSAVAGAVMVTLLALVFSALPCGAGMLRTQAPLPTGRARASYIVARMTPGEQRTLSSVRAELARLVRYDDESLVHNAWIRQRYEGGYAETYAPARKQ